MKPQLATPSPHTLTSFGREIGRNVRAQERKRKSDTMIETRKKMKKQGVFETEKNGIISNFLK